jgi:hypothetical protein
LRQRREVRHSFIQVLQKSHFWLTFHVVLGPYPIWTPPYLIPGE